MATFLLIVVFFAFIGLGIPDSIFGPAWPAINQEFNLPVSYANFVTVIISVFTVMSSILSVRLIKLLGTGGVTALSTLVTALALLGFSFADNIIYLCLLAIPLGIGAGSIDAALNGYVAINYKPLHMNLLHCFYGVGVAASPFLMSLALSGSGGWREGYRIVFLVQAIITVFTFIALPFWKKADKRRQIRSAAENAGKIERYENAEKTDKARESGQTFIKGEGVKDKDRAFKKDGNSVRGGNSAADETDGGSVIFGGTDNLAAKNNRTGFLSVFKIRSVRIVWLVFFASCALEFTCGIWGSTFLTESRGLSTEKAVLAMSFYYGGMALGRFTSGLISLKLSPWKIIFIGQAIVFSALILLALPLNVYFGIAALFLTGFGNGPLFPNLTHLTPNNFGADISQAAIGTQMAACNIGITLMPPVFGLIAQYMGAYLLPYYLLVLYVIMMVSVFFFIKINRREKQNKQNCEQLKS